MGALESGSGKGTEIDLMKGSYSPELVLYQNYVSDKFGLWPLPRKVQQ